MTVPARMTGLDSQSQILYQISKQLDRLIKIMSTLMTTTTTTTVAP